MFFFQFLFDKCVNTLYSVNDTWHVYMSVSRDIENDNKRITFKDTRMILFVSIVHPQRVVIKTTW